MRVLLLLLIIAANCVALVFLSLLAAGGDGSSDGVEKVLTFGAAWILAASLLSMALALKGKGTASILVAIMTLPSAYLAGVATLMIGAAVPRARPNSPAFVELCKTAGGKVLSVPAAPVRSIAYTWDDPYPPKFSYFTLDGRGNTRELAAGLDYRVPRAIEFTETRNEVASSDGSRRYKHLTHDYQTSWVPELTADALVTYKSTPIERAGLEPGTIQYDITVSDRRDGRMLGSFRYFLNEKRRRACGSTSDGVMSEVDFVSRTIGLR